MGDEIYINFEISNRVLYSFLALFVLITLSGFVFAYQSNQPLNILGHSGGEIEVTISGTDKTLQQAIDEFSSLPNINSNVIYGSPAIPYTNPMPAPYVAYSQPFWYGYNVGAGKTCVTMANKGRGTCGGYDSYCRYNSGGGLVDTFKSDSCIVSACSYVCY